MTTATTLESKETVSLIASDKVEGTAVYGLLSPRARENFSAICSSWRTSGQKT
jgi:hypothetical protein